MSNSRKIILVGLIVAVGMLVYYGSRFSGRPFSSSSISQQGATNSKWDTKTDDQASVNVTVAPLDLSSQSKEWKFDIGMNTHVVPLEQDMLKVVTLTGENGKTYQPLRWEGAPAGGHHREGVLIFSPITPTPKSVVLKISSIAGVERIFAWQL